MGYTLNNTYGFGGKYYGPCTDCDVPEGLVLALGLKPYKPPPLVAPDDTPLFATKHVGGGWYEIRDEDGTLISKKRGEEAVAVEVERLRQLHQPQKYVNELQAAMPLSESRELPPVEELDADARAPFHRPSQFASEAELAASEQPREPAETPADTSDTSEEDEDEAALPSEPEEEQVEEPDAEAPQEPDVEGDTTEVPPEEPEKKA